MSGPRFVRFYASDWRSGCIGMTPEEEGFYIRVCAHFWETGVRVPLDDMIAAGRLMLDVRKYRRLKTKLIEKGKLHVAEDGIYSPRSETEYSAATRAIGKEAEAEPMATARGQHDRQHADGRNQVEGRDTSAHPLNGPRGDIEEKSAGSLGEVSENFANKPNEINGHLKSRNQSLNRNTNHPSESEAAREADGRTDDPFLVKCKAALNGTTERAIEIVRQADGVYGTKAGAAQWLAELIDDTSAEAVIQAIRFAEAKRDRREVVANPKALIAKTAQTARANAMQPVDAKPAPARDTRPAWVIEKEQRRKSFLAALQSLEPSA